MLPTSRFRQCPPELVQELECPHCGTKLLTSRPGQRVSLTRCPQPSCHRVIVLCGPELLTWREGRAQGAKGMSLTRFVEGPPKRELGRNELRHVSSLVAVFTVLPMLMLGWALHALIGPALAFIALVVSPSLMLSLSAGILAGADALRDRRQRREIRVQRAQSFTGALMLPSATVPTLHL